MVYGISVMCTLHGFMRVFLFFTCFLLPMALCTLAFFAAAAAAATAGNSASSNGQKYDLLLFTFQLIRRFYPKKKKR